MKKHNQMIILEDNHHPLQFCFPFVWQPVNSAGKEVAILGGNPHFDVCDNLALADCSLTEKLIEIAK